MAISNQTVTKLKREYKDKSARSLRAAGTRLRILRTAIRMFARFGFEGVSVDAVVAQAKVNKRMVYHYFGSKRGLYGEALAEVYRGIWKVEADVFRDQPTAVEALEKLMEAYFAFLQDNRDFVALLLWENLAGGKQLPDMADGVTKAPILEALDEVVARGMASGELRPGLDRRHLLIHLMGICMMYFSNRHTLSRSMGMNLGDPLELKEGVRHAIAFAKFGFVNRT